jgi:RimJ/RimL family protein N-acetyltransferase
MEVMPYQPEMEPQNDGRVLPASPAPAVAETQVVSTDWAARLPVLAGGEFTLRELTLEDAPSLCALLTTEEVSRFITPPPTTVEGFEKFILWTHKRRAEGKFVCFGVVPKGMTTAVGIFQLRSLETGFAVAEWGFVIGSDYWGSGAFAEGARLVTEFAFETIGVRRLEARAAVENGRGNGALRKVGAVPEGILRDAFVKDGVHYDQVMWSILASDRKLSAPRPAVSVH